VAVAFRHPGRTMRGCIGLVERPRRETVVMSGAGLPACARATDAALRRLPGPRSLRGPRGPYSTGRLAVWADRIQGVARGRDVWPPATTPGRAGRWRNARIHCAVSGRASRAPPNEPRAHGVGCDHHGLEGEVSSPKTERHALVASAATAHVKRCDPGVEPAEPACPTDSQPCGPHVHAAIGSAQGHTVFSERKGRPCAHRYSVSAEGVRSICSRPPR